MSWDMPLAREDGKSANKAAGLGTLRGEGGGGGGGTGEGLPCLRCQFLLEQNACEFCQLQCTSGMRLSGPVSLGN